MSSNNVFANSNALDRECAYFLQLTSLDSKHKEALQRIKELFDEKENNFADRPEATRQRREGALKNLNTINKELGPEMFILSAFAFTITALGTTSKHISSQSICTWAKTNNNRLKSIGEKLVGYGEDLGDLYIHQKELQLGDHQQRKRARPNDLGGADQQSQKLTRVAPASPAKSPSPTVRTATTPSSAEHVDDMVEEVGESAAHDVGTCNEGIPNSTNQCFASIM
ncbi:hypothetical protein PG988_006496 [Apiospora saccharicola]